MKCSIKGNPAKLPKPRLEPTRAVDIGVDKMNYIPNTQNKPAETTKTGWTERDERILIKLKTNGTKDKEIAKKMGRTLNSIKWKVKSLKQKGVL